MARSRQSASDFPLLHPAQWGVLSASVSLLFRQTSAALSSSFNHVAINLLPLSITIPYHLQGSNVGVFHPSLSPIPNNRSSFATQFIRSFSLHPRPRRPVFSQGLHRDPFGQSAAVFSNKSPAHNNLLVCTVVSMLSQSVRRRARSYERSRWCRDLHHAPKIRSNILWCAKRSS